MFIQGIHRGRSSQSPVLPVAFTQKRKPDILQNAELLCLRYLLRTNSNFGTLIAKYDTYLHLKIEMRK